MKLCLAIFLISFLSIETHGSRVKRGLSADEQKKFLDVLNKDREEIGKKHGYSLGPMKYSLELEQVADSLKCESKQFEFVALQFNDVAEEIYQHSRKKGGESENSFFYPFAEIGCSKSNKCSKKLTKEELGPDEEKFVGKELIVHGACVVKASSTNPPKKFNVQDLPHPSKYGDLLGVPKVNGAALNSFFFLIFLFVVVFNI